MVCSLAPRKYSLGFVVLSGAPGGSRTEIAEGRAVEGSRGCLQRHAVSGSFLQGLSPEPHFASPVFRQVLPAWVGFFDQSDFFLATPAFELLLPADRIRT